MKVRLIGIGETGERLVLGCVRRFKERNVASLVEQAMVVRTSSEPYQQALTSLQNLVQDHLYNPQEDMWFRAGLGRLFFGPISDQQTRLTALTAPPTDPMRVEERFWRRKLLPRLQRAGTDKQFLGGLKTHLANQAACLSANAADLGNDWLVVPSLPLEGEELHLRLPNVGRKLMAAALKNYGWNWLVKGLGKKPPDGPEVDLVVIAFSAGDSFGVEGAELLAREIRTSLKDPEATRVIAILGFAVYKNDAQSLDGWCAGRYMAIESQLASRRGQLDGLIVRQADSAASGFPDLLLSIALASDPKVVQADNPDANQLQRDFGGRLFAAGFAQPSQVAGVMEDKTGDTPMNLLDLYGRAKKDLLTHHHLTQLTPVVEEFCKAVDLIRATYPSWQYERWVRSMYALSGNQLPPSPGRPADGDPRPVEQETARKVVAYIGHNGHLNASELRLLRQAIKQDFPRARPVVYKFSIDFSDPPQTPEPQQKAKKTADPLAEAQFALFLIDTFQSASFARLCDYVLNTTSVRTKPGQPPLTREKSDKAIREWLRLMVARSLLTCPFSPRNPGDGTWELKNFLTDGNTRLMTAVQNPILGGVNDETCRLIRLVVNHFVAGQEPMELQAAAEAEWTEMTIREAASSLTEEGREEELKADDLAAILCGLNVICNEALQPRQLKNELIDCLKRVLETASPENGEGPKRDLGGGGPNTGLGGGAANPPPDGTIPHPG